VLLGDRASSVRRSVSSISWSAPGAVVAPFSQAIGSFVLQFLALRYLGVEGLGAYALLFGIIVVATAIVSGLVGDSLTVLDRSSPRIRAGLQTWLVITAGGIAMALGVGGWITGRLTGPQSVALGVCAAMFLVEDALRRMLMASMRFWSLVVVDVSGLIIAVGVVLAVQTVAASGATLTTFIVALAIGQTSASAVAVWRFPSSERWIAREVSPDLASVWNYGSWRALQQMLRPSMLTGVRVIVTVVVSLAVFGELEAARLYVAPAMLVVGGVASYLFASYARDPMTPLQILRRRADRTVVVLSAATLTLGAVATALVPFLGHLFTSGGDELDQLAVFGWSAYAAATAAVTPYGSLAAVRGHQASVLAIRAGESFLSIVVVLAVVLLDGAVYLVPFVLAVVSAFSGVAMRVLLVEVDEVQGPTKRRG
jgi:O-antigen/teichoic acid export membrane protein